MRFLLLLLALAMLLQQPSAQGKHIVDTLGQTQLLTHDGLQVPPGSASSQLDFILSQRPDWAPGFQGLQTIDKSWQLGPNRLLIRRWHHQGVTLRNTALAVHLDHLGKVIVISRQNLDSELRFLTWGVPQVLAKDFAQQELALHLSLQGPGTRSLHNIDSRVLTTWSFRAEGEEPFEVTVDGHSGEVLSILPLASHLLSTGTGQIFEDSYLDGQTVQSTLSNLTDVSSLTGEFADVWGTLESGLPDKTASPTSDLDWTYPATENYSQGQPTSQTLTDPFAEVMMYAHINKVHGFFNSLGYFNDDPYTGIDRPMQATVNYHSRTSSFYNNAYYSYGGSSPGQMVFGQGEATDFSYDSSVIYHEYGHAMVNGSSGYLNYCVGDIYGSDCTQGGLNEGSADYFAATLRGDPLVGAYAIGEWLPAYVRDLRDPLTCPQDLYGEEHEDGRIWGSALWAVRSAVAGDDNSLAWDKVDPLILGAVMTPIDPGASVGSAFEFAATVLQTLAEAAVGQSITESDYANIQMTLLQRGMLTCQRFTPLQSGVSKTGAFSTNVGLRASSSAAGVQYTVTLEDSIDGLSFEIGGIDNILIFARKGAPVEFDPETQAPLVYDYMASGSRLDISGDSAGFDGDATYYIAFTSTQTLATALYGYYYTVRASFSSSTLAETDSGGCSCSSNSHTRAQTGANLATMTLLLGLIRRRQRVKNINV